MMESKRTVCRACGEHVCAGTNKESPICWRARDSCPRQEPSGEDVEEDPVGSGPLVASRQLGPP